MLAGTQSMARDTAIVPTMVMADSATLIMAATTAATVAGTMAIMAGADGAVEDGGAAVFMAGLVDAVRNKTIFQKSYTC